MSFNANFDGGSPGIDPRKSHLATFGGAVLVEAEQETLTTMQ